MSKGRPQGRGVSGKQALNLYEKLSESRAVKTGVLSELADAELVIEGIGHDKISDITTNIIRRRLITYTQDQCRLHGVPTATVASGRLWDPISDQWTRDYVELPTIGNRPIILVPKVLVRREMAIDHQEYYQHFVLEFLQIEELRANSGLVRFLQNGKGIVTKKSLKMKYPMSKEFLYEFTKEHPEVLADYKREKRSFVVKDDINVLDDDVDEAYLAREIMKRLHEIPSGPTHASAFHQIMIGALEFIFYPNLICPVKEHEIHDGRKRIDITYTNAAKDGLFSRAAMMGDVTAKLVMVECKNYSHDPANPELDQLGGRFSPVRGRLGLLVARKFEDRALFMDRCRDTARDHRGFIIPLADEDVVKLLEFIAVGQRDQVDSYLSPLFNRLLT